MHELLLIYQLQRNDVFKNTIINIISKFPFYKVAINYISKNIYLAFLCKSSYCLKLFYF